MYVAYPLMECILVELSREIMHQNDEISIFGLVEVILSGWKILVLMTCIFALASFVYLKIATPKYKASVSFFISGPAGGNSSLLGYASILGAPVPTNIEDQVQAILESRRIQLAVGKTLLGSDSSVKQAVKKTKPKILKRYTEVEIVTDMVLDLKSNVSIVKTKSGLFKVEFFNQSPTTSISVINSYMAQLDQIYLEMGIGAERDVVKVLDQTRASNRPVKPDKPLFLMSGILFGFLSGILLSILRHTYETR